MPALAPIVTGAAAPSRADARMPCEARDLRREGQFAGSRVRLRGLEGRLRDRQPPDIALELFTNETDARLPPVAWRELQTSYGRVHES